MINSGVYCEYFLLVHFLNQVILVKADVDVKVDTNACDVKSWC